MRKYQQNQILDLITTMYEATEEIYKQFSNRNIPSVINLLCDCQDAAVYVGECIESLEGDDTQTVRLLTQYHDHLYNIASEVDTIDVSFVKDLTKELRTIESCIRSEFKPNKIEIVFFPYKASMWDSLESIWLAAKEDPQCDAYVVPIPYFDKLPGGELGEMQYEGHQYPDYVPIVDWQSYNIEERRPDISFIHNGYDESNVITTVHPYYYSKNLKKYTELLCYSPYFVAANDVEEHFCTLRGVAHSDRVFVQSEKARNDYIQAIQAYEKKHKFMGFFGNVNEKIVASGSPKFDKVINSKRDDFELPAEWRQMIEKPDGSWKKIVLYNTSIGPILRDNEKYLAKLESVFHTFRNRDDVVLWWRPHPLSEATYGSMRPKLFDKYRQLIEEFKLAGYGIYDDTADLHRALHLSNAFYGDGTSLLQMYQCMKKPVMVQTEESNDPLIVGSVCDTGEDLWFLSLQYNGLFRLNKETWEAEYMGSFANEKAIDWRLYHSIHQSGHKLYFPPNSAEVIAIYDLKNSSFQKVELPLPSEKKYNDQLKFVTIIECDGSLYFIPIHFPGIVRLDMKDNSVEIIDDWVEMADKIRFDPELGYFSNGVYDEARGVLVLALRSANAVMELELNTQTSRFHTISHDKCGYSDILLIDETYWLLAFHKPALVRFNLFDNTIIEHKIVLEGIPSEGIWPFQKLVYSNSSLFLVPGSSHQLVEFNLKNNSFSSVDNFRSIPLPGETLFESKHLGYQYFSSDFADKIYVTENQSWKLLEYDLDSGCLRQESIKVGDGLREFQHFQMQRQGVEFTNANSCAFWEHNYATTLNNLLDIITQPVPEPWLDKLLDKQVELRHAEISHPDGKAGAEIYENSKKAVLWS